MDRTDPKTRIDALAAELEVAETARASEPGKPWEEQPWRIWTLRERGKTMQTRVIQGPECIVVTGDLADFIFERHGGLALGFIRVGDLSYAAGKCRAGEVYEYSAEQAKRDVAEALADFRASCDDDQDYAETITALEDDEQWLDYDDERAVNNWWHEETSAEEYPHFGRVYSDEFLRACACILRVYEHETATP